MQKSGLRRNAGFRRYILGTTAAAFSCSVPARRRGRCSPLLCSPRQLATAPQGVLVREKPRGPPRTSTARLGVLSLDQEPPPADAPSTK